MSGVAPAHLPSGSQPSIVRGPHGFPPHRSSLEEHGMHDKGNYRFGGAESLFLFFVCPSARELLFFFGNPMLCF